MTIRGVRVACLGAVFGLVIVVGFMAAIRIVLVSALQFDVVSVRAVRGIFWLGVLLGTGSVVRRLRLTGGSGKGGDRARHGEQREEGDAQEETSFEDF